MMQGTVQRNLDQLCAFLTSLGCVQGPDGVSAVPSKVVSEMVRTSLQFQEVYDEDSDEDFTECSTKDQCGQFVPDRPPLVTFSQLIGELARQQQQQQQSSQSKSQQQSQHQQSGQPNRIQGQHSRQPSSLSTAGRHQRGPSRIKDILMSLRAGIVTDLQKIADELLSDPLLHQRLEGSDQNGYKTLGDALDDAGEQHQQPKDGVDDQIKEESIEIQTSQYSSRNQEEPELPSKAVKRVAEVVQSWRREEQQQHQQHQKSASHKGVLSGESGGRKTLSSSSSTGAMNGCWPQATKFQMLQDIINEQGQERCSNTDSEGFGSRRVIEDQQEEEWEECVPRKVEGNPFEVPQEKSSQSILLEEPQKQAVEFDWFARLGQQVSGEEPIVFGKLGDVRVSENGRSSQATKQLAMSNQRGSQEQGCCDSWKKMYMKGGCEQQWSFESVDVAGKRKEELQASKENIMPKESLKGKEKEMEKEKEKEKFLYPQKLMHSSREKFTPPSKEKIIPSSKVTDIPSRDQLDPSSSIMKEYREQLERLAWCKEQSQQQVFQYQQQQQQQQKQHQQQQQQQEQQQQFSQLSLQLPASKSTVKRNRGGRKRARAARRPAYNLDIIEEQQSFEQFTPDKLSDDDDDDEEEGGVCEVQSLPCMLGVPGWTPCPQFNGSNTEVHSGLRARGKAIDIEKELGQWEQPADYEGAILASWNRLCQEIIRKNLLPITLNLERVCRGG